MLRSVSSLTLFTGLMASAALAQISSPWPAPAGCHLKGVSVHTFYGAEADMNRYIGEMPARSLSSRVRVVILEKESGATVRVYERASNGYVVSEWTGKEVGSLRSDWDDLILKSRGNSCAGADLKADVETRGMRLTPVGILSEATNGTTLAPLAQGQSGYMRVSVYDPCE